MATTTATILIVVLILVVIALAVLAWMLYRQQRSRKLRSHFGPEYERAYREYGGAGKAEEALAARQKRVEKIHIHSLTTAERDRFGDQWHGVQSRFVDDPSGSIREADRLVIDLMQARGYPMADFERRAEDISVDYPHVVNNYRTAHTIAVSDQDGHVSTEELRKALVCYRDLFDELLEGHAAPRR
jgi:hypothetical protein